MIRKFKEKDFPAVNDILKDAFDMCDAECRKMLVMINPTENLFLVETEYEIVCVASAIPVNIGDKKGRYIYAVATKKNNRNKGYATSLLKYMMKYFDEDVILLKPASENLFDFYRKIGFDTVISADICEYYPQNIFCDITKCELKEYIDLRKKFNNFNFDDDVVKYYVDTYKYSCVQGCDALALYRVDKDVCYIDEVYGINKEILIQGIIKAENAKKAVVTKNGDTPFALAHFYNNQFDIKFRIPME